ncbi:hypothetical protein GCM10023187_24970 [Nibrella viscosa]|uniref:Uncharacterized protein n=1 Tax=Nibrella viscosa TaxID=1084524 RepID=A0ABP8KGZ2_9BACT
MNTSTDKNRPSTVRYIYVGPPLTLKFGGTYPTISFGNQTNESKAVTNCAAFNQKVTKTAKPTQNDKCIANFSFGNESILKLDSLKWVMVT